MSDGVLPAPGWKRCARLELPGAAIRQRPPAAESSSCPSPRCWSDLRLLGFLRFGRTLLGLWDQQDLGTRHLGLRLAVAVAVAVAMTVAIEAIAIGSVASGLGENRSEDPGSGRFKTVQ